MRLAYHVAAGEAEWRRGASLTRTGGPPLAERVRGPSGAQRLAIIDACERLRGAGRADDRELWRAIVAELTG